MEGKPELLHALRWEREIGLGEGEDAHTCFFGGGRWGLGTSVPSAPLKPELEDEEEGLVGGGCDILAVG